MTPKLILYRKDFKLTPRIKPFPHTSSQPTQPIDLLIQISDSFPIPRLPRTFHEHLLNSQPNHLETSLHLHTTLVIPYHNVCCINYTLILLLYGIIDMLRLD